ncbi:hypothetical protein KKA24_03095 [Patescibacteria group bacterium]|nr:hypothetical protein [Patescibacteria group bacterium]
MGYYIAILIGGFGGGAIRGLTGFVKHQYSYKNVGFNVKYFLGMTFISGIVGLLIAMGVKETASESLNVPLTPAVAFIVAYAGGDFLENIYKIFLKKK